MAENERRNSLEIRLTESAVFLRSNGTGRQCHSSERPSMLRGLLILKLAKPTRITSIELELTAKSVTTWPEGIGSRRAEVTEEHKVFRASAVYFRAGEIEPRRNSSIGPGATCDNDDDSDDQHTSHTPRYHDGSTRDRTTQYLNESLNNRRAARHLSADSSFFQRAPLSHEEIMLAPIPPYSPSRIYSPTSDRTSEDLYSPSGVGPIASIQSPHPNVSHSRHQSIESERGPSTPRSISPPPSVSRSQSPFVRAVGIDGHRGRKNSRSRFSLSSVSNALMDAVRSNSPRTHESIEQHDDERARLGRTREKRKSIQSSDIQGTSRSRQSLSLGKFGGILKCDQGENQVEDGWKEFRKGTYTYPISFSIPANSPPTLRRAHGSVCWRLRATVHRPGAFSSKLFTTREVNIVTSPTEEVTEDTENAIIERYWDHQLQYLISVPGRSFCIGGTIPISITLMPLTKVRIHRISVAIEERVDYYTQMRRIARTDPVINLPLLSIKKESDSIPRYILPLESNDVDAFKNSPLLALVTSDDDLSETVSGFMGPGPWAFHQELKLPTTCGVLGISNKNRRSNIIITHQLKCTIRVERGDDLYFDPKTGKRKLFDIVVQIPIQILSCRCNPEWSSLPPYSESFNNVAALSACPCNVRRAREACVRAPVRPFSLERMSSKYSSDSGTSAAETSLVNPRTMPSLLQGGLSHGHSYQYERLISGQESEIGEAPPTYTASLEMALGQPHRSHVG